MNKLTFLFLLAGGLRAEMSAAQQVAPKLKTEYLDASFSALPSATGAHYRRETEYCDSVGGTIRQYFPNGRLYSTAGYEHILKNIAHGAFESWYANGQLAAHEDYTHGQLDGERRMYFTTGQLKRYEQYQDGQRTAGECYTEQGQPVAFSEYEVLPVYPEGQGDERAIVAAISRNIHYPQDALTAGVQGQVFVKFLVTKDGQVDKVEVVKSVLPSLDAATVQAVQQLRAFKPGFQDGEPAAFSFTVPVSYTITPARTLVQDHFGRKQPK